MWGGGVAGWDSGGALCVPACPASAGGVPTGAGGARHPAPQADRGTARGRLWGAGRGSGGRRGTAPCRGSGPRPGRDVPAAGRRDGPAALGLGGGAGHLQRALALRPTLPDTPARRQQELAVHLTLGQTWIATKGPAAAEVEEAYTRAQ